MTRTGGSGRGGPSAQGRRRPRPPTNPTRPDHPGGRADRERLTANAGALLWRFLAGTGLRLNEARRLTVGDLIFDGDRPAIDLPPTITKAKRKQYVPLHPDRADRLRRHVAGRGPTEPVFSILADILRRFKADCERAGIALVDERGRTIEIHAPRTSLLDA